MKFNNVSDFVSLSSDCLLVTVVMDTLTGLTHSPIFYDSVAQLEYSWDNLLYSMLKDDKLDPSVLDSVVVIKGILNLKTAELELVENSQGDPFVLAYTGKQAYIKGLEKLNRINSIKEELNSSNGGVHIYD